MVKANEWHEKIEKELEIAQKEGSIPENIIELVSELRVHQSELEMQNEELRKSQEEYTELYFEYSGLFNDLPFGYFTLDKNGIITDVNDKGAELLQLGKDEIIGYGFSHFLSEYSESKYFQALADTVYKSLNQKSDLKLKRGKSLFDAQLEIMPLYYHDKANYRIIITDITEPKKTEESLYENESKYHGLFNSMEEAIQICELVFDDDGKPIDVLMLDVNPAYEKHSGLKRNEVVGRRIKDILPVVEQIWLDRYGEIVREEKPMHFEEYNEGVERWFDVHASPLGYNRFAAIFTDITGHKKAEEAVKESERMHAFHSAILESVRDPLWTTDSSFRIRYWNDAATATFGWTADEVQGRHTGEVFRTLVPGSTRDDAIAQLMQMGDFCGEAVVHCKDGSQILVEASSRVDRGPDGEVIRVINTARDITERKKAEEDLRESEERFDLAVNATQEGIWDWNIETNEVWYSHRYKEMLGYSDDEIEHHLSAWLRLVHLEDKTRSLRLVSAVLRGEQDYEVEFRLRHKDGHYLDILSRGFPVRRESDGKVIRIVGTHFDLTERKQMVEELRQARNNLEEKVEERTNELNLANSYNRSLIEASLDPLVTIGSDGKINDVNIATERVTGYPRDELIGTDFSNYFTEPSKAASGYQKVFKEGEVRDYPLEIKHKNGQLTPVLYHASVYRDEFGEVIGVFAAARDITKQKEAGKQLKERTKELYNERQRLFDVLETMPIMVCLLTHDYHVPFANRAFREMFGESHGRRCYEYCYSKTEPCDFCESFKPLETGQPHFWQVESHGGKIIDVYDFPFTDIDGSQLILEMDIDITEQKQAEEELKKLATVVKDSNDAVTVQDFDGDIIAWNYGAEKMYGWSEKEALQMNILNTVPEPKRAEMRSLMKKIHAEELIEPFETQRQTKDGRVLDVWLTITKLTDDAGNSIAIATTERDITKQKQSEEDLKNTLKELKHSNKELQSFAYITSHDLQEPLRTIASFTQLLERRYKGQFDSDADEFMDYIVSAAIRMKDMIQGLLEYSRIDTRSEPFREFNSEEAVNHALSHLHSSIEECNAEITYENLPTIIGDEHQIVRVFQNLVGNALKFRKEEVKPEIHISAQKIDGEYIFSVSDNGIGMEKQYSKKIFEPFKRIHTIDAYEGTGIGLSVVKRIIEHHGGRIWFESSFGEGSVFYFTLPKP